MDLVFRGMQFQFHHAARKAAHSGGGVCSFSLIHSAHTMDEMCAKSSQTAPPSTVTLGKENQAKHHRSVSKSKERVGTIDRVRERERERE